MNTVEVVFPDHIHTAEASPSLWQWDYGQRLIITGALLPDSYEVHFCNAGDDGTKSMFGDMTGVDIPDEYLQTGKSIFAYIYLHTGEDDGETVYKITIKVKPRARPTELNLTEVQRSALDQAIAQLEKYTKATRDVDSTPTQNSGNLITSGGVYEAIRNIIIQTDDELLDESDNPVKNFVITTAINALTDRIHELEDRIQEQEDRIQEQEDKLRDYIDLIDTGGNIPSKTSLTAENGERLYTEDDKPLEFDGGEV